MELLLLSFYTIRSQRCISKFIKKDPPFSKFNTEKKIPQQLMGARLLSSSGRVDHHLHKFFKQSFHFSPLNQYTYYCIVGTFSGIFLNYRALFPHDNTAKMFCPV